MVFRGWSLCAELFLFTRDFGRSEAGRWHCTAYFQQWQTQGPQMVVTAPTGTWQCMVPLLQSANEHGSEQGCSTAK